MTQRRCEQSIVPSSTNILCVACGYDLRGLSDDDNCPECGIPVERSMRGDGFDVANPQWLNTIINGMRFLRWSMALLFICIFGFLAAIILFAIFAVSINVTSQTEALLWMIAFASYFGGGFISLVLGAIGLAFVTRLEPRASDVELPTTARRIARYGLIVAILLGALVLALDQLPFMRLVVMRGALSLVIILIAITIPSVAGLMVLQQLAQRARIDTLAVKLRKARLKIYWAVPIFIVGYVANHIFKNMGGGNPWVGGIFSLMYLIGFFWSLAILSQVFSMIGKLRARLIEYRDAANVRSTN